MAVTKTILIPTDFSIESLNLLKSALSRNNGTYKVNIILLHGFRLNDSIMDLLFYSKEKMLENMVHPEFNNAFHIIRNKYQSQINYIRKEFFSGYTQSAFNIFVEANKIEEAYIPTGSSLNFKSKKSYDLIPFIRKSSLKITEVDFYKPAIIPEKGKLAEIFDNGFNFCLN